MVPWLNELVGLASLQMQAALLARDVQGLVTTSAAAKIPAVGDSAGHRDSRRQKFGHARTRTGDYAMIFRHA